MTRRLMLVFPVLLLLIGSSLLAGSQGTPADGQLFAPEDLGILESPDRDAWQQPDRIMDALQIADGSTVADIGAGGGWFTVRLARRVGPNGKVYAQDIQMEMINSIRRRALDQGLTNVEAVLGGSDDPKLPPRLDAILMVDTYPQLAKPVETLRHVRESLAPDGLLGIVDFTKEGAGGPGPPLSARVDPQTVRADAEAAGLVFRAHHTFLRYQYLLVFGR
jgi:predicted methyltransferase